MGKGEPKYETAESRIKNDNNPVEGFRLAGFSGGFS